MNLRECFEILGLEPGADAAEVRRAYMRLVQRHHPDRTPDSPENHDQFCRITQAYALLNSARRGKDGDRPDAFDGASMDETCTTCGDFGELRRGLDGAPRCPACLLDQRRKRLPMPAMATARCIAAIALQAAAVGFLVWSIRSQSVHTAAAAVVLLFGALAALTRDVARSTIVRGSR